MIQFEDICLVCGLPEYVKQNSDNRLHSTDSPAIKFSDGFELYYLNGVQIEKDLFDKIPKMKASDVFKIGNTEQRRVVYEIMDKAKMKSLKNYKTLSKAKDGKYWMKVVEFNIDGFREPFRYLNCKCPSTGREYFLETEESDCRTAKAKSFGFNNINFTREW